MVEFLFVKIMQESDIHTTQPFTSWTLNEETCLWNAPTPMPTDDKMYVWDEPTISWKEATE
jgi:hypothetical protein